MNQRAFGIFDHLERRDQPLDGIFEQRLALIADADSAGFLGYHLAEHHATPLGMAPSPGIFLAAVAARTRRIRLGPLVYLLPLYHPLRLVEEICMLDNLSGGRLDIGVGRGVSPFELAYHHVPFMDAREIFEEALAAIVTGLRNPQLNHHGQHYRYDAVPMELAPAQRPNPPFWYGSATPDSVLFAARHGMHMVGNGPNAALKKFTAMYAEELKKHKGGPDDLNPHIAEPRRGAIRHCYVAADDADLDAVARPAYRAYYNNIVKLWLDFRTIPAYGFTDDLDLARRNDVAIAGTVGEVRDQVGSFFEHSGCDYLVLSFAFGNLTHEQSRRSLERFATQVMPDFPSAAVRSAD
ncbi:MAG TPA: LLM class flavin-dependent oxidoreductase [Candidatus Binataceae bacterium]|nr:LLM class flavin-dependent oxidoreductase [Candidatus Binataceae bacterium]